MNKKIKGFMCIVMIVLLWSSLVLAGGKDSSVSKDNAISLTKDKGQMTEEVKEKAEFKQLKNKESKAVKPQGVPLENKEDVKDSNKIVLTLKDIKDVKKLDISEEVSSTYEDLNTVTIDIPKGADPDEIIKKYEQSSIVDEAYVEPVVRLFYTPTDPYYHSNQWNLKKIGMESAWDSTKGDSSVVVAVIDTGFGPFSDVDSVLKGVDVSKGTTLEDTYPGQYSYDGGDHGTAITSLISSNMNAVGIAGIAPDVSILPVKIFENGAEETGSTQIAAGIRWAVDHGADLINLSLGSDYSTPVEESAIDYALSKNVMIIAASGNDGRRNFVSYPAAYDGVVAVGSTNSSDRISNFSNEGNELDIVAPGESILLPCLTKGKSSYIPYEGTSFSSPTVCAVASLIKSKYPDYSNDRIEQILYWSADDIGIYGKDTSSGYGRINAAEAMSLAADDTIFDENDDKANATKIYANRDYEGKTYPVNDRDYYTFTLLEPYAVSIRVTPSNTFQDMVLELSDANRLLASEDSSDSGEEVLNYVLDPGTYYINAYEFWGEAYEENYHLNLMVDDITPPVISASSDGKTMSNGATTDLNVIVEVKDTSYQDISVTRDGRNDNFPKDGLFSEPGEYFIQAVDAKGNTSDFQFTIVQNNTLYSVSYDSRGGTPISRVTVPYNTLLTKPDDPLRVGYTFSGWYREAECKNVWDFSKGKVSADTTLYAKWMANPRFSDVPSTQWAYGYIENLANQNIIGGYADGTFKPNNNLTRAQAAKMIVLASGMEYEGKTSGFSDVPAGETDEYIAALSDAGIVKGYEGNQFRPNEEVKRSQIAKMVTEAFDLVEGDVKVPAFPDLTGDEETDNYINVLASNGIVKGKDTGKFEPYSPTTRAQFSKIISTAMEK